MESLADKFVRRDSGSGSGNGDGNGYGDGYGYGYGSGYGDGSGNGDGNGYGFGCGNGYGSGFGYGYGNGSGFGDGYGNGSGSGYGDLSKVKKINGHTIYEIDGTATIIQRVRGSVAKGAILQSDLALSPCYVVRQDGLFAHGESLGEAMEALRDKMFSDMPQEERIEAFIKEHELGTKYENGDFFLWHHYLTGSCEMGRRAFVRDKGIDLSGRSTPEEFIALTKNAYGGEVIKELARRYGIDKGDKDNAHKHRG